MCYYLFLSQYDSMDLSGILSEFAFGASPTRKNISPLTPC